MDKLQNLLNVAKKRVGIKEFPKNSNNVDCNTWFYGHAVSGSDYPWCAVEMCYEFHLAGLDDLIKKSSSCADIGDWFKKKGQFFTSNPQVGDLVFYKFPTTRHDRWCNHIGLIGEVVNANKIKVYEGNTSVTSNDNGGSVMYRTRDLKNVVGFGRPNYGTVSTPKATKKQTEKKHSTLTVGSKGEEVLYLHKLLRERKYGVSATNDTYNQLTKACVINVQATSGYLEIDGICGKNTWEYLEKH